MQIFVSHSSQDAGLVAQLVDLLRTALNLRAADIRCTSLDGYRLPVGADSDEQLRREVFETRAFLGILSPDSLASAYVLFELGARWGVKKHLAPLLAPGLTAHALKGPIAGLNALRCDSIPQLQQLVHDLATHLEIVPESPQVYQGKIDALVYSLATLPAQLPGKKTLAPKEIPRAAVSKGTSISTGDDYADADAIIRHHCEKAWPDDFNMRAHCIEQQQTALAELRAGASASVPEEVFSNIRRKCANEWPEDYTMRVYCESQQVTGYLKVHKS